MGTIEDSNQKEFVIKITNGEFETPID